MLCMWIGRAYSVGLLLAAMSLKRLVAAVTQARKGGVDLVPQSWSLIRLPWWNDYLAHACLILIFLEGGLHERGLTFVPAPKWLFEDRPHPAAEL